MSLYWVKGKRGLWSEAQLCLCLSARAVWPWAGCLVSLSLGLVILRCGEKMPGSVQAAWTGCYEDWTGTSVLSEMSSNRSLLCLDIPPLSGEALGICEAGQGKLPSSPPVTASSSPDLHHCPCGLLLCAP